MNKEELKIRMKQRINGLYTSEFSLSLLVCILIFGLIIFSEELSLNSIWPYEDQDYYRNVIKAMYLFIVLISITLLILYYWPRQFDDRELELYDQYLKDLKILKRQIRKEKLEQKIKELEKERSQI